VSYADFQDASPTPSPRSGSSYEEAAESSRTSVTSEQEEDEDDVRSEDTIQGEYA